LSGSGHGEWDSRETKEVGKLSGTLVKYEDATCGDMGDATCGDMGVFVRSVGDEYRRKGS